MNGVEVELHTTPAIMNNPLHNHRMQQWLRRNADLQCSNLVMLPNVSTPIAVPTNTFNIIYQLFHLYHHYFFEGVGLRQIIDYYFVITNCEEVRNSKLYNSKSQAKPRTIPNSKLLIQNYLLAFLSYLHHIHSLVQSVVCCGERGAALPSCDSSASDVRYHPGVGR